MLKKKLLFVLVSCFYTLPIWAQKNANKNIPNQVIQQFSKRFANVTDLTWASTDEKYEAAFSDNGVTKTAVFTSSGEWLAIEQPIQVQELPQAVSHSVAQHFPGYQINQAIRIEKSSREVGFRIRVKQKNGSWSVEVDMHGKIRKKEEIRVEEEDCEHHHHHKHKKEKDKHKHKHKHKHHCHGHNNYHHHDYDDHHNCDDYCEDEYDD